MCTLAGNENEDYYSIGSGVHMGESAESSVLQEVFEETGIHYEIKRLAVIHENFFNNNSGSLTPFVSATKRRAVWLSKICNRLKFCGRCPHPQPLKRLTKLFCLLVRIVLLFSCLVPY
jgi:NADH pyrophosphatase NudC (nudix superfamily)